MKFFLTGLVFFFLGFWLFTAFSFHMGALQQSLIAAGSQRALTSMLNSCQSGASDANVIVCIRKQAMIQMGTWGLRPLMTALADLQTKGSAEDFARLRCHDIAHAFGQAGALRDTNLTKTLLACTDLCASGCYHGAIEGWVARGQSMTSGFPDICAEPGLTQDSAYACFHGLGHAVASYYQYDLTKSLAYCDRLTGDSQIACGSGVFMELYEPITAGHATIPFPVPSTWCSALQIPYDEICYNRSGVASFRRNADVAAAVGVCRAAPKSYANDCVYAVGKNMYFTSPMTVAEISAAKTFCQTYAAGDIQGCMTYIENASAR